MDSVMLSPSTDGFGVAFNRYSNVRENVNVTTFAKNTEPGPKATAASPPSAGPMIDAVVLLTFDSTDAERCRSAETRTWFSAETLGVCKLDAAATIAASK